VRSLQVTSKLTAACFCSLSARQFAPSWDAVAKAWTTVNLENRDSHFFATLDFDDAPAVFQKVQFYLTDSLSPNFLSSSAFLRHPWSSRSAPPRATVQLTRPALKSTISQSTSSLLLPLFPLITSVFTRGFDARPLADFLSHHTPVPIPYREPIDTTRVALLSILALSLLLSLRFAAPIFQSRWTWAIAIVLTSLIMISGYMFTRIRSMPYVAPGGWIAPGFQSQYGQEVHVVAFICTFTSSSPLTHIYPHPFRWLTILRLPYAPTRCPSTDFTNSPTCSGLSLYCCHHHRLFSPPLPLPCKESWLSFQALLLRGHSHVSSSGIHFFSS